MRIPALFVGVVLALAGCTGILPSTTPSGPSGPAGASPGQARQELATLTVAAGGSMAGYSRTRFPHWIDQGHGCNTRDVVLERQGTGVSVTATCKITHGTWVSPYDNMTWTDPQKVDIDHLVPLADAWRSGASAWTDAKRQEFANDLTRPQLIAVTLTQNRAKGDQDPAQWKPPNRGFWCQYAEDWIAVKRFWALTITVTEKTALTDMLGTCA